MNIEQILPFFPSYKRSGNGRYMAACPMPDHRDSDPSVSITQDVQTGKILMFCWGCNSRGHDLVKAIGLRASDLQGDPGHTGAISTTSQGATEVSEEDLLILEAYLDNTHTNLHRAESYVSDRFGMPLSMAGYLKLGVDTGAHDFPRPAGYEQFNSGVPHLIIPFLNPTGKPVGMQGRRLVEGEPRWRSKSGGGWSKIGCFGWDLDGPVVITEGPSDALAVVGRANLPALAVRGASLTHDSVADQIKEWLAGRDAVVIGDNGEAGEKFTNLISQKTGIPAWRLPEGYGDVCEYLQDGQKLDAVFSVASTPEASSVPETRTPAEIAQELVNRIVDNIEEAIYDDALMHDLRNFGQVENILTRVIARAGYGQRGNFQNHCRSISARLRTLPPPAGGGGDNGDGGAVVPRNDNPNGLPEILWNIEDQLQVTENRVRDAMNAYEGKDFYQAAPGQYVKVIEEELVPLKEAGVKSMLSQVGHWRVLNGQREIGHVPQEAAKMVTDPSWECDIQTVKRRVEVPFMLEDGSIVAEPGFHEPSGVFLLPRSYDRIVVPEVPAIVTDEHIVEARRIFDDVVEGFVFKDEASQSNLIAMTLTSPLRELFCANPMVPLLTSTAPQSGSGKGTSIRVPLSTAGIGPFSLSTTAYNSDENEFEKKLVGKLLKKSTYIFLDNIRSQVNSAVLEQMLTAANYDGRTLGYSEVNSLSTLVMWVSTLQSTGSFNRDLTRRTVPVELIKNYKGTWRHKNIDSYLADMRGQLIWATFVAARKWLQDGGPVSTTRLDGYTGWVECIGGILENTLGYESFLGNLDSFRKKQDEVAMTIDGILEKWLEQYGEDELPARFAIEDFDDVALHRLLGLHNPTPRQVLNTMTRQLEAQEGHIVGNSHMWMPVGVRPYGNEEPKMHFACVPLPRD